MRTSARRILVYGVTGSGKTTLAERISQATARAGGLAGRRSLPRRTDTEPLSQRLLRLRDEDDR